MIKRVMKWSIIPLVVLCVCVSCKNDGKSLLAPASSGRPYEMLVVMDDSLWNKPAGRALFEALDTDVPGLPQSERSFRISQISTDELSRSFSIFRNIIMPDIQNIYSQPKFKFSRDVKASPQIIMSIQAPDEESFETFVRQNKQVIVDFFTRVEMNRQVKQLKKKYSSVVDQLVKDSFDCRLFVPTDISYYKRGTDFLWASSNKETDDLNLVVYSYPFTDKETFTIDYFVHKRDSFMKANLPGPYEGSYMATDTLYVVSKDIVVKGEYAQEVKGLWAMKGATMGGPFVSHVRVDKENGRIVVVEGFIYAPNRKKRDLIRKMEAALYTLQLPGEEFTEDVVSENIEEEK